jgi:hypothetical protein
MGMHGNNTICMLAHVRLHGHATAKVLCPIGAHAYSRFVVMPTRRERQAAQERTVQQPLFGILFVDLRFVPVQGV